MLLRQSASQRNPAFPSPGKLENDSCTRKYLQSPSLNHSNRIEGRDVDPRARAYQRKVLF